MRFPAVHAFSSFSPMARVFTGSAANVVAGTAIIWRMHV
jgi:hypothetical protein